MASGKCSEDLGHFFTLAITPVRIFHAQLLAISMLTIASAIVTSLSWVDGVASLSRFDFVHQMFALDAERNLPTWYQTLALGVCGLLLGIVATGFWTSGRVRISIYWLLLGLAFAYLSLDEVISLHELSMHPVRELLGIGYGPFYFAWVLLAVPLVILFVLVMSPFLHWLPFDTRVGFLVAGAVYVSGAAGLEMLGSLLMGDGSNIPRWYHLVSSTEEVLEMIGVALFSLSLIDYVVKYGASALAVDAQMMSEQPVRMRSKPPVAGLTD